MDQSPDPPLSPFAWSALAAASATGFAASLSAQLMAASGLAADDPEAPPPGATPSRVVLELECVRLRSYDDLVPGAATLLCTPLALHSATLADLAHGHSLVQALRSFGLPNVCLADWRSARPNMSELGIDDYLAALNVLVDKLAAPVDLIGLCQGGWLALVYAARFPAKVRRLVLAGAPVDLSASPSRLSALAQSTPSAVFRGFVIAGNGRVIGHAMQHFWRVRPPDLPTMHQDLQSALPVGSEAFADLATVYRRWDAWTLNLPGRYYLEVVERLYKKNDLAEGRFVALGEPIDLARLATPLYLLAGDDDDVVAPGQLFALRQLVGSAPVETALAPCGHLGLFMGATTLTREWHTIASWLQTPLPSLG
jgi:poly(3-hydroxyalkanoate) synthetase